MSLKDLKNNPMMAHLAEALEKGKDIGHYGRLVFAMVARHFLEGEELCELLAKDPSMDDVKAAALVEQVCSRDYNPPRADKIAQWQAQQDFPICPANDPDACNVYRNLTFPDGIYDNIQEYHEQKVAS
jgi:hypothetical protein